MSNAAVGNAYEQLIGRVIQASQIDFEESGIDRQTLNELKELWQSKLSALRIASFPWDPAPSASQSATLNPAKDSDGSVRVKAEPGYEFKGPNSDLNGYPSSGMNTQVAQQRAAILLQQQYGSQANASIGALQQQTGLTFPGQSHPNNVATTSAPPIPVPSHPQPLPQLNTAEEEERKPGINRSQNDGAGDEQHEIDETKKHANDPGRRPMRAKVQDMVQELESGLLMPLNDRPKPRNVQIQTKKRAVRKLDDHLEQAMASKAEPSSIPQLDGERTVKTEDDDENEELDEDAINSDLDDSEDEVSREQDEEVDLGETMLCLYDKVQRVKNKWKCTLKDGVLTTGGKEYLFHKAQGEFEW